MLGGLPMRGWGGCPSSSSHAFGRSKLSAASQPSGGVRGDRRAGERVYNNSINQYVALVVSVCERLGVGAVRDSPTGSFRAAAPSARW